MSIVRLEDYRGEHLTIAGSGEIYTITRRAGSFINDGITIAHVIRLSGPLNAANANKNLLVIVAEPEALTVKPLNGVAMVAEGPIAGCAVAVTPKKSTPPHPDAVRRMFGEHFGTNPSA